MKSILKFKRSRFKREKYVLNDDNNDNEKNFSFQNFNFNDFNDFVSSFNFLSKKKCYKTFHKKIYAMMKKSKKLKKRQVKLN